MPAVREPTSERPAPPYAGEVAHRLRPIRSGDKAALASFHERLSDESRYRRYHAAKGQLSHSDLRYLTEVDGHRHLALVAEFPPPELDGVAGMVADFVGFPAVADLAGVARIVSVREQPEEGEVAIVVRDDVHQQGLGAELVAGLLAEGRRHGMRTAVAHVQAENHRAMRLFQGLGFRQRAGGGPVVELVRELEQHSG